MSVCDRFVRDITENGKITRRFTFLHQNTYSRSFFVNVCQFINQSDDVVLSKVFLHLAQKGLPVKNYSFEFEAFNLAMEPGDKVTLPLYVFLKDKQYKIRMMKTEEWEERSDEVYKKPRESERVIRDVLYKLKKWRLLHERCNYSLINAAKQIQVQKKTLDDYYFAVRVGQAHNYDFKNNLNKKIGDLREYIRSQNTKINGKVSTKIQSFQLVPQPELSEYETKEDSKWLDEIWEDKAFVPYIPDNISTKNI